MRGCKTRSSSTAMTCGARWCASRMRSSRTSGEPDALAIVGIHRRGAVLATRAARAAERAARRDRRPARRARHLLLPRRRRPAPRPAGRPRVAPRLRHRRAHGRHRRRRPLHRAHGPRRDRGAVRLRPPRQGPARRPRRPRPPRAADPPRLRRQEPADLARRARQRPRRGARRRRRGHDHRTGGGRVRHLLSIEELDRAAIERICDRAAAFAEVSGREIKKVPALRGRTVLNLFYEASTRTALELRARGQAPERRRRQLRRQRLERREGRVAQGHRADAQRPQARRDRHPHPVGRRRRARLRLDDAPRSSTPATASTSTRPRRCSTSTRCARDSARIDGANIWIVGDVRHSRVARSNILAFQKMGAQVTVCGPPTLIPRGIEALGCEVRTTLDDLHEADVVYALRMQNERMTQAWIPSHPRVRRPATRSTAAACTRARC